MCFFLHLFFEILNKSTGPCNPHPGSCIFLRISIIRHAQPGRICYFRIFSCHSCPHIKILSDHFTRFKHPGINQCFSANRCCGSPDKIIFVIQRRPVTVDASFLRVKLRGYILLSIPHQHFISGYEDIALRIFLNQTIDRFQIFRMPHIISIKKSNILAFCVFNSYVSRHGHPLVLLPEYLNLR